MSRIRYKLSVSTTHAHELDVEARFDELTGDGLDLKMAAWTPGSYLIREYSQFVRNVVADDGDGQALRVHKLDKLTWRIQLNGCGRAVVRYSVYGYDLTVRSNHIDDSHAFINGAPTYLWCEDRKDESADIELVVPDGWHVATSLRAHASGYRAANVDELIDSPIHMGPQPLLEFEAAGKTTRIALWGQPVGHITVETLVQDVQAIIESHVERLVNVPYDDYTFILMLSPKAYGGLEHKASSALLASPFAFSKRKKYEELLELFSHEYFHLWNVKRIHPKVLGPFAYDREAYTRALWLMEGVTSYYDRYTVLRAGCQSATDYLSRLADDWKKLQSLPGRLVQSVEAASFDAWIKLYRPHEDNANSTVSYYLKGSLVAVCLDLEIRQRGDRSLDDVLRHLWKKYGVSETGFDDDDLVADFSEAAGFDLREFFTRSISGLQDPDLAGALSAMGLQLSPGMQSERDDEQGVPWLGLNTKNDGGRVIVANVLRDSPAERAGISPGDEVVACDGYRTGNLAEWMQRKQIGETLRLSVFRRDQLREVDVKLGEKAPDRYSIEWDKSPSPMACKMYAAWLGEPHPNAS